MNRIPTIFTKRVNLKPVQIATTRELHLTGVNCDITWRRNRRLPKNPNSSGPLTDLPDYTFMDGRPTPIGVKTITRNTNLPSEQRALAEKIVQGIREVNFAKDRYQKNLLATEEERQSILKSKLKPKGGLLTKKE